jgi:putative intracellular protease/amidase
MIDLPDDKRAQQLLTQAWQRGAVVASVCHGPAALLRLKDPESGEALLKGRRVACFTNQEEVATGYDKVVPFMLADELAKTGAHCDATANWQPHVVRDGRLVTGQNPASSARLADVALEAARAMKQ